MKVYAMADLEKFDWLRKIGVEYLLDYHESAKDCFCDLGVSGVGHIVILFGVLSYLEVISSLIKPFGRVKTSLSSANCWTLATWKIVQSVLIGIHVCQN